MSKSSLLDDVIWKKIEKVLPVPAPRNHLYAGRKPVDPRKVISGIVYILVNKIPWEDLPQELGFGSGMTCWRRLRLLQEQGVWDKVAALLKRHLPADTNIDLQRSKAPKKVYNTKPKVPKADEKSGKNRAAKVVRAARKGAASRASRAATKSKSGPGKP